MCNVIFDIKVNQDEKKSFYFIGLFRRFAIERNTLSLFFQD
ncbi:hypothetical protein P1059_00242 [Pasteurella multocida subsp. gallicida P1059]|nr:hypothetical protein P1059_00242 [Pasteurella multocida subsp. gallicida P1059]